MPAQTNFNEVIVLVGFILVDHCAQWRLAFTADVCSFKIDFTLIFALYCGFTSQMLCLGPFRDARSRSLGVFATGQGRMRIAAIRNAFGFMDNPPVIDPSDISA